MSAQSQLFENALRAYLNASALTIANNVYLEHTTQRRPVPYLIIDNVAPRPIHSLQAGSNHICRTYQLTVYDASQSACAAEADALRQLLDGFSGTMTAPPITPSDVAKLYKVGVILYITQRWMYEPDLRIHAFAVDFHVQYDE